MNKSLDGITIKINKIVESLDDLKKSNITLKEELKDLHDIIDQKNKKITFLEEKIKLSSIVKGLNSGDKKNVNSELNKIIKMVDECITSLNTK
ncbi:MAG: hypothetical protein CMP58_01920 [Flavobacteriales bacterium]|nr:hypothetical protein [Flavobacteriales bacterium]|tara:strand:- start:902 stop:1180 length:279 start_codon:yes stop_codon:yes gene_type:complete